MQVRRILRLLPFLVGAWGCARGGEPSATAAVANDGAIVRSSARPAVVPRLPAWGEPTPALQNLQQPTLARDFSKVHATLNREPGATAIAPTAMQAWALARIGETRSLEALLPLTDLDDRSANAAQRLAALGLLEPPRMRPGSPPEPSGAWVELERRLWTRFAVADDADVRDALRFAIARTGGTTSVALLSVELAAMPTAGVEIDHRSGMEVLGMLCSRGFALVPRALDAIAQALDAPDAPVFASAAYALGRCAVGSAELLAGPRRTVLADRLERWLAKGDETAARLAWRAFAALGEVPKQTPAAILSASPPAWTTEVEAVRALGATPAGRALVLERLASVDWADFVGSRVHVLLEALRGLKVEANEHPERVTPVLAWLPEMESRSTATDDRLARVRRHVLCELATLQALHDADESIVARCGAKTLSAVLEANLTIDVLTLLRKRTSSVQRRAIDGLIARAQSNDVALACAALGAIADLDDARVNAILRSRLQDADPGVVAAAASSIAVRSIDASKRDPTSVDALVAALDRWSNGEAVEVRISALAALGALARSRSDGSKTSAPWLSTSVLPLARDGNIAVRRAARDALLGQDTESELLVAFERAQHDAAARPTRSETVNAGAGDDAGVATSASKGLRVTTAVGVFDIEFAGVPAPATQQHLAGLADNHYFDGLRFHRVVPGFVVQGGDPRGDGYGGPGEVIPCEWSNLRYERGTVGMALAGKDTGGSQFFIVHTPQPHLDGRYTVVGRVRQGMDVVDQLLPHDVMEKVEPIR